MKMSGKSSVAVVVLYDFGFDSLPTRTLKIVQLSSDFIV